MIQKCDHRGSKPQNLMNSQVTTVLIFTHPLEELNDGKEEGEWEAVVPLNRRPQGRSLRVTDGQTPTVRCVPARLDTAGSAPGRMEYLMLPHGEELGCLLYLFLFSSRVVLPAPMARRSLHIVAVLWRGDNSEPAS